MHTYLYPANRRRRMCSYLRTSWSHISHNPLWAAVIGTVIAAAVIGIVDSLDALLTRKSPAASVERAEIRGGTWGPSRSLYRCMPDGQCIAPNHVVFDSITNDPRVGNEVSFMGAMVLGGPGFMQSSVNVEVGDTVLIRALIENDAAIKGVHGRSLVATGTRFRLSIPPNSSSELPLIGHISATNAAPQRIYDAIFLHAKTRFAIEYDWGSAALANRAHRQLELTDDIVGEGVLVGSGRPNGTFRPGLSSNAAVFLLVHIVHPIA
jgi:hypothetical protein